MRIAAWQRPLSPGEDDEIRVVKMPGKKKTVEDRRWTRRVFRNANLVSRNGKTAAIALAGRGVGPETAAQVVGKLRRDKTELSRDILRAEREHKNEEVLRVMILGS